MKFELGDLVCFSTRGYQRLTGYSSFSTVAYEEPCIVIKAIRSRGCHSYIIFTQVSQKEYQVHEYEISKVG